jgi:hydrogenase maturation protease
MLTIIGCGNSNRMDDAVGVVVANRLREYISSKPNPNIRIFDAGTAGIDVMLQARGSQKLVIIDANQSNSEPGTVFKVPGSELENLPQPSYNLHDFRWDNALYAGRKIFKDEFPKDVTVYLIEAGDVSFGLELTPAVADAAEKVVAEIQERVIAPTATESERETMSSSEPVTIHIRNKSVYLENSVCETYFKNLDGIVLQIRESKLIIMPIRQSGAGGLLLKILNSDGDRIINAHEFFRENGLDEKMDKTVSALWDSAQAGLVVDLG